MYYPSSASAHVQQSAIEGTRIAVLVRAFAAGTGGDTIRDFYAMCQDQGYQFILPAKVPPSPLSLVPLSVPSTQETLQRIREVFPFSVSELAAACKVTRQAVYKWMSENSPSLEAGNQNRIDDLCGAAELFAARGIAGSAWLLRRRDNSGKTLVETMQGGGSAETWARGMLEMLTLESQQRAMLDARLRERKRPAPVVEEWGIPMLTEDNG